MGQYHYVCNLDKRQFLHPHALGDGLKLLEFGYSGAWRGDDEPSLGTMGGLALLLGVSCKGGPRGGGDPGQDLEAMLGAWGGDRIAIVGDYAEPDDLPPEFEADKIYRYCSEGTDGWIDISPLVLELMRRNP